MDDDSIEDLASTGVDRPYHSKRPHRKSRLGCRNCKARKVKCDEGRPRCRACTLRKETCAYPSGPSITTASASASASASSPSPSSRKGSAASPSSSHRSPYLSPEASPSDSALTLALVDEPLYQPPDKDITDMKLLWYFTAKGFESFAINARESPQVEDVLRVRIPQNAFYQPFLMDCLLAISALQMRSDGQDIPQSKALTYRYKAFEGYRMAIQRADPESFPALLAGSLLLCALSSQMFREPDTKPLYIIDWMTVWKGIGLIVSLIRPENLFKSGMTPLFARPAINLNEAAKHIPGNLLFMISSLPPGDADAPHAETYYETLKYLGALYKELKLGFSGVFGLRVITWLTFLPRGFTQLARERRPRALIIIAHYLIFARICDEVWWMKGVGGRDLDYIVELLGRDWKHALRVPIAAVQHNPNDKAGLARLLLEDHDWASRELTDYHIVRKGDDSRALALVDDSGEEVELRGNKFRRMGRWPSTSSPLSPPGTPVIFAGLDTIDPNQPFLIKCEPSELLPDD